MNNPQRPIVNTQCWLICITFSLFILVTGMAVAIASKTSITCVAGQLWSVKGYSDLGVLFGLMFAWMSGMIHGSVSQMREDDLDERK